MTIDGLSVSKVFRPESIEELSETLAAEKGAIVPIGAATQLHFGNPLRRADCAVDLTRLSRITEYNPADLTVHVESGVTLRQLERTLLENNQYLPINPWNGAEATIGGIAAADAQGPLRATGAIRDWIIGMKVVHVDGRVSKTGGRVVKNVTGYDLAKLYTGSLGTLAIIAEISLKLRAKFGRTATAITSVADSSAAASLIAAIRQSSLQPISLEWVGNPDEVWIRFGEHPRAVEWQLKQLPAADWSVLEAGEEIAAWEALRQRYGRFGPVVVRVIGPPSAVPEILEEYRPDAWVAHALNGIVLLAVSDGETIHRIRRRYRAVIEKAPIELRQQVATFGLTDDEYVLMRKIKHAYDPEGRLSPGRHVDGERQ